MLHILIKKRLRFAFV